MQEVGSAVAEQSAGKSVARRMHSCGGGANIVELNILTGVGLSLSFDVWTKAPGDRGNCMLMNRFSDDVSIGNVVSVFVGEFEVAE